MKNPFAGIEGVKASRDANYVTPGHYVMRLDAVKIKENRKGEPIFLVEMTPLHVLVAEEVVAKTKKGNETLRSNKPGVPCTQLISFAGPGGDMALPNIKAFVCGVTGCAEEEVTQDVMKSITSEEQPLAGVMVEVSARLIRTRNTDLDFTKVKYIRRVTNEDRLRSNWITKEEYDALAAEAA